MIIFRKLEIRKRPINVFWEFSSCWNLDLTWRDVNGCLQIAQFMPSTAELGDKERWRGGASSCLLPNYIIISILKPPFKDTGYSIWHFLFCVFQFSLHSLLGIIPSPFPQTQSLCSPTRTNNNREFYYETNFLGKPSCKKSAVFFNIVQKAFDPPPPFVWTLCGEFFWRNFNKSA